MTPHEGPQTSLPEDFGVARTGVSGRPLLPSPAPAVHRPAHQRRFLIGVRRAQGQHDGVEHVFLHHAFDPDFGHLFAVAPTAPMKGSAPGRGVNRPVPGAMKEQCE